MRVGTNETLSYNSMPPEHWRSLRTNHPLKWLTRKIRRRTRVVEAFPDGKRADAGGGAVRRCGRHAMG
ncbi:MAG: transposase [Terracidiphilus sp.]